jgi:hypothetical protein
MAGGHEGERELPSQRNDPSREQGSHHKERGISKLLEARDLFPAYTPEGKDPTCYPIEVMENLVYDTSIKVHRGEVQKILAENWPSWKKSIKKVQMAYEITAYPLLELAEARFASDPKRDPTEHGPSSYEMAINELIRDAQEHPDKDTQEYPHRAPIELNDEEMKILSKITQARELPFNPKKRVYHFLEHLPRLDAKSEAIMRGFSARIAKENAIDTGMLRERSEIEEEIRQREESWRKGGSDGPLPGSEPSKPQK